MKSVRILGGAPNLRLLRGTPDFDGETWIGCIPRVYRLKYKKALTTWTRWFNLHTRRHMLLTYPSTYRFYSEQSKPIYLQEVQPDIPSSVRFPREEIQAFFGTPSEPFSYFTCSATWLIALAIMEGFDKIELCGFELKRDQQWDYERPCFFYWIDEARRRGIEVILPPNLEITPAGDPALYTGPLYGYEPHSERYKRTF